MRGLDEARFPPPNQLNTVQGALIHTACSGASGDITLIMISGAGGSSAEWRALIDQLPDNVQVCALDRPGLGWSPEANVPRDLATLAAEIRAWKEAHLVGDKAVLVGHSFGGYLAQYLVQTQPDEFEGLVLIDALSASFYTAVANRTGAQLAMLEIGAAIAWTGLPRVLGLGAVVPDAPADLASLMRAHSLRSSNMRTIAAEARAMPDNQKTLDETAGLPRDYPVLVLSRQGSDNSSPYETAWQLGQEELAQLSDETTHYVVDTNSHHLHLARPDQTAARITAWMQELD